jgi:D-alanyl-D-alanine carboxypeptidase (penicillin-binding protein 5/6)
VAYFFMTIRSSRIILVSSAVLLVIFLAFRFGGNALRTESAAQMPIDGVPVLASTGGILPGSSEPVTETGPKSNFKRTTFTIAPFVTAHAALVADATTGDVFFNFNSNMRWPVASLTKLMTAVIAKENMDLSQSIVLAESDFAQGGTYLTRALEPGSTYRGEDLLKIMLTSSSNEAAEAFARVYGRSKFLAAMNQKALEWGLTNTSFSDPSGIAAADQSTASDYKELALHVWREHPEFFAITRSPSNSVFEQSFGTNQVFLNTNTFAGRADFLGGKTGTTPEAGENLLSFFSYRSHPVIIVVFGSDNRFAETEALFKWFTHDFSPSN